MNYEALMQSLWITLAGMAIVFSAIIVLWIGIALLMKFTKDKVSEPNTTLVSNEMENLRKRKAAAAAVAYALSIPKNSPHTLLQFPLPPTALVSAWQAVMRSNIFSKRGRVR